MKKTPISDEKAAFVEEFLAKLEELGWPPILENLSKEQARSLAKFLYENRDAEGENWYGDGWVIIRLTDSVHFIAYTYNLRNYPFSRTVPSYIHIEMEGGKKKLPFGSIEFIRILKNYNRRSQQQRRVERSKT